MCFEQILYREMERISYMQYSCSTSTKDFEIVKQRQLIRQNAYAAPSFPDLLKLIKRRVTHYCHLPC
jgi:hypothetical protein